jgi:hypothetical protein
MSDEATQSEASVTEAPASEVTPEIQAKFLEVFGDETPAPAKRAATATPQARQARRPNAELEALSDPQEPEPEQDNRGPVDEFPGRRKPEPPAGQQAGEDAANAEANAATLHPLLRQAAQRVGWQDADIDNLVAANPELADATFRKFHDSLNAIATRFSQFAVPQQQQQLMPSGNQPQGQPQQQPMQGRQQLTPDAILLDLYGQDYQQKFAQQYGENFASDVVVPLLNRVVGPVMQMQQFLQQQEQALLGQQINGFFTESEKDFADLYGKQGAQMSREQNDARFNVLRRADQIRAGAMAQGIPMTVREAIDMAHLQFAAPMAAKLERQNLTRQVKNRSGRITQLPTQRRPADALQPGERSERAALEAATEKMAAIGLND